MSDTTVKKTSRARKTVIVPPEAAPVVKPVSSSLKNLKIHEETFADLLRLVNESKEEFITLQKEINEVRESWNKEQKDQEIAILERNQQEEIARKRESETYNYETTQVRRKSEDEFLEKKAKWERELETRKDELAKEKQELDELRKLAASSESEKEKAVKQAEVSLQKELSEEYAAERRLREQEVKGEKELLALRITNLTQENARQANEIASLKKSLENATAQLKDVAVKVIESGSSKVQAPVAQES